jgi:hypothetical protein
VFSYVLIIITLHGVATQEFGNKSACLDAVQAIQLSTTQQGINAICVKKV